MAKIILDRRSVMAGAGAVGSAIALMGGYARPPLRRAGPKSS